MATAQDQPPGMAAEVHVLFNGYVGERTASTVGFIRDGAAGVIVDPGMVPDQRAILDPLAALGESPAAITDVNVLQLRRPLPHRHPR